MFRTCFIIFLLALCSASRDRVRLRDVETLTFHHNARTTSRRGPAVPQLSCIGGSAVKFTEYYPRSVQCYNRGFDGHDVHWECKAQLDKDVKFGSTVVNCEGFSYPEDEYVLAGSCGLEYELEFVQQRSARPKFKFQFPSFVRPSIHTFPYLIVAVFFAMAFAMSYFGLRYAGSLEPRFVEPTAPPDYPPPNYEDAMRNDGPPFAYHSTRQRATPREPNYGWNIPPRRQPSPDFRYRKSHTETPSASASWLPTGLAAGAGFLGGYLFGSSDQHRTATTTTTRTRNRLYPEFGPTDNDDYVRPSTSATTFEEHTAGTSSDRNEPYIATAFAKTKRR